MQTIEEKIEDVLFWAKETLRECEEPPWLWYQYMKLKEALEALQSGGIGLTIRVGSRELVEHQESVPRALGPVVSLDIARRRRGIVFPERPR